MATRDLFLKAVNNIQTRGNIDIIITRDGRELQIEWYDKTLKNEDGNLIGLLCVGHDITERKRTEEALRESEKRYRDLFETSLDGIAETDLQGRFTACNRAFLALLEYDTMEELLTKSYEAITPPEYHEMESRIIAEETMQRGFCEPYEKEYVRRSGERIWVSLRAWLRRDNAGNQVGMWVIVRDITEAKRIGAEREKLIKDLQDALAQIKTLQGIIPICMYCKKIRDDKEFWHQLEAYISDHSDALFSHGICPECAKEQGYDD